MNKHTSKVIPAVNPYKPENCDLFCGLINPNSAQYLEIPPAKLPDGQVLPLTLLNPNGIRACSMLGIDIEPITVTYECPYTQYEFYAIVPVALISSNLEQKWGEIIKSKHYNPDYLLDHAWHRHMWKDNVFEIYDIDKILLGTGYSWGITMTDGGRRKHQTSVNLDNGDALWVHFWQWCNK